MAYRHLVFQKKDETPETALANIDKAAILISKARNMDQLFKVKAALKLAEIEAHKKGLIELQKQVVDYQFMLEDKTGAIIEELKEEGKLSVGRPEKNSTSRVPLKSLGVTKNESSRAQKFHRLPEDQKKEIIESAKAKVGKKRPKKPIDQVPPEHVHEFVFCSCGLKYSLAEAIKP